MSDGNASDDSGRNKRTRFTDTFPETAAAKPSSSTQSPLAAAKKAVDAYARTLQPTLATIVVDAAADYLSQRATLFYKQRKFDQMTNDVALIPRSAKVELTLEASPEVKKGQEYQALAAEAADVITECQKQLKMLVLKCLGINLSDLKLKVQKSFATSIPKIAEGFITHDNVMNYASHQSIVDLLATNYDAVTCHLNISKADFIKLYCEVNEVESLPSPTGTPAATAVTTHPPPPVPQQTTESPFVRAAREAAAARQNDEDDEMDEGEGTTTTTNGAGGSLTIPTIGNPAKAAIVNSLRPALETIYVSSWNSFLAQIDANERIARLKRLAKEQRLDKKADDVAQLLNAEGNVDPKCLADLIRKEVANQRISDQQKIKSLEAKVRNQNIGTNNNNNRNNNSNKQRSKQKNNERGRGGAARQKKSATRSPTPPKRRSQSNARHSVDWKPHGILRNPRSGRGADDRSSDSPDGYKSNSRNRSSSKSNRRSKTSRTKTGRSDSRSGRK
jgi:dimeric dUTPase (all-alpha-NTP-PPase superfamily)